MQRSKEKKSCSSILLNFFAQCKPMNLLVGYLALSSLFLGKATAEPSPKIYLRQTGKGFKFFGDEKISVLPKTNCALNLQIPAEDSDRNAVIISQVCEKDIIQADAALSLRAQVDQNRVVGSYFINGMFHAVTNAGEDRILDFSTDKRGFVLR